MPNVYCVCIYDSRNIVGSKQFGDAYVAKPETEQIHVTDSKGTAQAIAQEFAKKNPGKEVYVFHNSELYLAETPKVLRAIVNDKGEVLPE